MYNGHDLTIRSIAADDALNACRMHVQSWLDTYIRPEYGVNEEWIKERTNGWLTPENIAKRTERISREVEGNPDHIYLVAVDNSGKIVGLIHASKGGEGQHLHALYIDKHYYGSGIARQFMDRMIAWSDPTQPIHLEVAIYNERAKAFYRKYNFIEIPGTENKFAEVIPTIKMEREGETV